MTKPSTPSTARQTVRASVKVRTTVVNHEGFGGDWADHMEAEARLGPTTAGLNVSGTKAWKLQIKLIWHREFPTRNIATTIARPFNGCCATVTGGMMLPPAEALPSVDGG